VLTCAVLAAGALLMGSAFVAAPQRAPAPPQPMGLALSAAALVTPMAAHAAEGS
jgi:hypothetical protein